MLNLGIYLIQMNKEVKKTWLHTALKYAPHVNSLVKQSNVASVDVL
jgi:hypothetical protein